MRIFFTFAIIAIVSAASAFGGNPVFPLKHADYVQRGILSGNGNDFTLTAYVRKVGGETRFVLDSQVGVFASVKLDENGAVLQCDGGAFMPKSFVEKFILRDIRAVLGFLHNGDFNGAVLTFAPDGRALKISSPEYKVEFSDYENVDGFAAPLPKTIKITAPKYKMLLTLAKANPSK